MPVLQSLSDIYLRNTGVLSDHTLRGEVVRVVPTREREYRGGVVCTVYLKDLRETKEPSTTGGASARSGSASVSLASGSVRRTGATTSSTIAQQFTSSVNPTVVSNDTPAASVAAVDLESHQRSKAVQEAAAKAATNDTDDDDEFTIEPNDPKRPVSAPAPAVASATAAPLERGGPQDRLVRIVLYDEWTTIGSCANVGDVVELRSQFRVFANPDTDGSPVFAAGRSTTEHLVTTTPRSEVSVFSKQERDVLELFVSADNVKGEPLCRVARNIAFKW